MGGIAVAVGACVGKLVEVGSSTVGKGVAVGRGVLVGKDVGVDGLDPETRVLVGVGDRIAGKVVGVTTSSSRGAFESK